MGLLNPFRGPVLSMLISRSPPGTRMTDAATDEASQFSVHRRDRRVCIQALVIISGAVLTGDCLQWHAFEERKDVLIKLLPVFLGRPQMTLGLKKPRSEIGEGRRLRLFGALIGSCKHRRPAGHQHPLSLRSVFAV